MFRGKLLYALHEECFELPPNIPRQWVANVKHIGKGLPALEYLSRYLYRGVISPKNIVGSHDGNITFRYKNSETHQMATRTLAGEDFIWKLLTHVLPGRFRRVRDYGFLHHNAKNKLTFIRYFLGLKALPESRTTKPVLRRRQCLKETTITAISPQRIPINFRFMKSMAANE